MKKYEDFTIEIKEGLILTHDINRYSSNLMGWLKQLDIYAEIDITDKLSFDLIINTNDYNVIEIINHKCYTLGYFPSYYWITNNKDMIKGFKNIDNLSNNIKIVKIRYEAKYEDGLYTNNIICPDKLYHLSYQKHEDSILKKGLYPKSKKRISVHPERIYLFDDINKTENLLNILKFSDLKNNIKENYILLEIDCTTTKLILHTDPNYKIGYFTYDNINPINIKILNENL